MSQDPPEDDLRERLQEERQRREEAERAAAEARRDVREVRAEAEEARQRHAFLQSVRRITNEATDDAEAFQDVLEAMCEYTGWPVGHVYRWDYDDEVLVPGDAWCLDDPERFQALVDATEGRRYEPGQGVPGRTLAAREPRTTADVSTIPDEPRAGVARELGVPVVYAVPVETEGQGAVVEFFTDEVEGDPQLLETLLEASTALQPVVERVRSRRVLEEAKDEAEEARRAAEQANEVKSRFLAGMSHEIRTPLNAVMGMAELLEETDLDPEQRDQVETIRASSDHLLTLVTDLLDFAELEADALEIDEERFGLRDLVDDALDLVANRAGEDLELRRTVDDDVPDALVGDRNRIMQVLMNLLTNAVKFTDEGYVAVRVTLVRERTRDLVVGFEVEDTGRGIPEDEREDLFEAFTQVDDSTTREAGGTGLGLAVCDELVRRMGGGIDLESAPGEGTRVRFVLPLTPAPDDGQGERAGEEADGEPALDGLARRHPLEVLVAEDNAVNRKVVTGLLERGGYDPDVAVDGAEAIEAAREVDYDLVLMDIEMPEVDGIEATERILDEAEDGEEPRVVALTGHVEASFRSRAREAGIVEYVAKPVDAEELAGILRRATPAPPTG